MIRDHLNIRTNNNLTTKHYTEQWGHVFKADVFIFILHFSTAPFVLRYLHNCSKMKIKSIQLHYYFNVINITQQFLVIPVPRHQLSSYGRWAFCVAGPSVWNSLPDSLRNPIIGGNSFRQSLKTFLFATYWCIQCIRGFTTMRYINWLFTYLL